ncbi:MAG TPA: dihydroorotate dehydrogenase [Nitrososphaeraceae archaeon]|nr:dihydroorotate dehydrogenase [Nitrososphaeraceae archaeon]
MDLEIDSSKLNLDIAGISLRNPGILASGFLGISQAIFERIYGEGAGAVVSKSISRYPMEGYTNPTVVVLENKSYINAVGLSNPGCESFYEEVRTNDKVPLIVSLVGSDPSDFEVMTRKLDRSKIIGFEINLSCPHVQKLGMEVGDDPQMVKSIVETTKSNTTKPVFVKVGVGSTNIIDISQAAIDAGADGITAINTIRAMKISIDNFNPILSNKVGGLSGTSIKPIAIRCVYELSKKFNVPIIGCGGVSNWADAVEFMIAGAASFQVGTAIGFDGVSIFNSINMGIVKYLERKGYQSVMELIGRSHKY